MPGLMNQQPPQEPQEDGVSPEEQQMYEKFVTNGLEIVYNDQIMPQLMQMIASAPNPSHGLAQALINIVMRLEDSATENGVEITGDVKMQGATEIIEALAEILEEAGVHAFTEEEKESAFLYAMDLYRESRQLPEEPFAEDLNFLMQADQQGALEQELPGITEYAQTRGQPLGNLGQ